MVKISALIGLFCMFNVTIAQDRVIQGAVRSVEDGEALPGVNVMLKSTAQGTVTDYNGKYSINVPADITTLVFSYIGYVSQEVEIGNKSEVDVQLMVNTMSLQEIVVTALGIKKDKSKVGFAIQDVDGADLIKAREPNPVNSLTGKIAGLTIAQSAELLGAPNIFLRGKRPLFVVDGVPIQSDTWNISPDDIDNITVLKGPNASALYGSRGQYGAIEITTKRGSKDLRGFSVDVNSSTMIDNGFLTIPKVQSAYGPGDHGRYAFADGKGGGLYDSDYDIWGPPFEGQLIPQYNGMVDPDNTYLTSFPNGATFQGNIVPTPWEAKGENNLEQYLQSGLLSTNNIAVMASGDKYDIRFSTSLIHQGGIVPNTKLNSYIFNVATGYDISPKFRFEAGMNYNKQYSDNFPDVQYGPNSMIYNIILWAGADWSMDEMRNYWQPGKEGLQQVYADYTRYNNPWFMANEWLRGHNKTDIYGYFTLKWQIAPSLEAMARTQINTYDIFRSEKFPYSATTYGREQAKGDYREDKRVLFENNTDFMLTYNKKLSSSFSLLGSLGTQIRNYEYNSSYTSTDYLNVPGLYTFNNSLNPIRASNFNAQMSVFSVFGFADLSYLNFLNLSLTGRWDKNSTLPLANNSYFYPSASLSAVLSEVIKMPLSISLFKLRGSYARVGGGLTSSFIGPVPATTLTGNPLGYGSTYQSPYEGPSFQNSAVYNTPLLYNNLPAGYYTDAISNPNLEPEFSSAIEAGVELGFFQNRLVADINYFNSLDGPKIYQLPISETSGYTTALVNGIETRRTGYEVTLSGRLFQKPTGFRWDITANWSTYKEVLEEIYPGVESLPANRYNPSVSGFNSYLKVGDRVDKYFANSFYKDQQGNLINDATGKPMRNPVPQYLGNLNPDWSWAFINKFSYKNWSMLVQIDGRVGGYIVDYVQRQTFRGGRHFETTEGAMGEARYQDYLGVRSYVGPGVQIAGGTMETDPTGKITNYDELTFAPNSTPEFLQDYISRYYRDEEANLISRTYTKLREVTIGYSLPSKLLDGSFIKQATFSLVGRNLLYWAEKKDIDIDQFGGYEGYSSLQSPTLRRYGFNINVTF